MLLNGEILQIIRDHKGNYDLTGKSCRKTWRKHEAKFKKILEIWRCILHIPRSIATVYMALPSGYNIHSSPWFFDGPNRNRWFTVLNSMVDLFMAKCNK